MKSLQELSATVNRTAAFAAVCKHLMLAGDQGPSTAAATAESDPRCPRAAVEVLKAAVSAGSTNDPTLAGLASIQASFVESLARVSAFDLMLGSMRRVPLQSRIVSVTSAVTGSPVSEAVAKPISFMSLTGAGIERKKGSAIVALTEEALRSGGPALENFLLAELRRALSRSVNSVFLAELSTAAGAGTASTAFEADVVAMLGTIEADRDIQAVPDRPAQAGRVCALHLALVGGSTGDITLIASDAVPANVALLVDADALAASAEAIVLDSARHASLQMDTAPTQTSGGIGSPDAPVASTAVSLWQTNSAALRAERFYGFKLLRTNVVTKVTAVASDWGTA